MKIIHHSEWQLKPQMSPLYATAVLLLHGDLIKKKEAKFYKIKKKFDIRRFFFILIRMYSSIDDNRLNGFQKSWVQILLRSKVYMCVSYLNM